MEAFDKAFRDFEARVRQAIGVEAYADELVESADKHRGSIDRMAGVKLPRVPKQRFDFRFPVLPVRKQSE